MLEQFAQWCQNLALADAIRSVAWPFPTIEIVHLAGIVLVFGSILITNLRMFGFILKDVPAVEVARSVAPWTLIGLGFQVISGPLMFITSATRFYGNETFRVKLLLLAVALIYHFAIHRKAASSARTLILKLSAAVSMLTWIGVVLAGMGIELLA